MGGARLVHVTTTDMSLVLLLGPQLRAFSRAGYEVIGCSAPGRYADELESWGIRHVPLRHSTRSQDPAADLLTFGEMVSVFRRLEPDVVHTHNPKPGILGRLAARACGVPVVVNTVHGLYAQPGDGAGRRLAVYGAERLASCCSGAELVQNVEDLEVLRRLGVPERKLTLLGNGVDLERFSPRGDDRARSSIRQELGVAPSDVVVGVVGRLVWEKGYREIFELAARLKGCEPPVRVVVVGPEDAGKKDAVGKEAIREARAHGVCFLGERKDMERLYTGFDLYVLASHREGFPRSAMEAAAMGLPVVATDIRGCRQVVEDGRTGILVPPRDAARLAAAVGRLARSPAERETMGSAGREKALLEFDQQRVIDLTLDTYDRLLRRISVPGGASAGLNYRLANHKDAGGLAELHARELPGSFLTSLGSGFLERLYETIVASEQSFAIVAVATDRRLAGFVAGTGDTGALYRRFLARRGAMASAAAISALVRSPRQALETLSYGSGRGRPATGTLPRAELLSLAVDPAWRRKGVGRGLVQAFQAEIGRRGAAASRVVVGSGNVAAISLYQGCGFRPVSSLEVHRGERSEVLVWP
ncbi:MAG: GNAT family N-acetyltransferase [Acidimicrobiales bacterium]